MRGWLLKGDGHVNHRCYSAIDALEWNTSFRADVISCNLRLTEMSDYEFAGQMRTKSSSRTVVNR